MMFFGYALTKIVFSPNEVFESLQYASQKMNMFQRSVCEGVNLKKKEHYRFVDYDML